MNLRPIDLRNIEVGDHIRIMHISDLHFNRVDKNKRESFESNLRKYNPDIIVITGDLINSPWFNWYTRNLDEARAFVDYLNQRTNLLLIALGNHEKLFSISKKKFLNKFNVHPYYCYYVQLPNDRNITFFVFDSTSSFFTQRGKINVKQFEGLTRCVNELHVRYAQDYRRSFKIAVLHHHPLPTRRNDWDEALYLKNAGELIENLTDGNINMVLHGHQHDPVDYSFRWIWNTICPNSIS
jgi:3',5'-cyclic AMP phosphodiesterase CpdA